ncbi:helix-turn-helix domain-containing protein [Companilactobacillus jidongensis]|uniref:helix-turn-helix domain-containing protein n=1 Tax=Companilactobacillus jidongensis TaxID=2486006 RepID=UPI0013DE5A6B|nr:helix-turn-helix transcriptional regulator [Companilactobacillus jidongensis]
MNNKNRLKMLRKKAKLTLDDVEEQTGIKRGTFSNYENGKTEPNIGTWQQLADFFDVSLSYISGNSNEDDAFEKLDRETQKRIQKDKDELINNSYYNGINNVLSFLEEDVLNDGYGIDSMELISNSVRFARINGKGKDIDIHRFNIRLLSELINTLNLYQLGQSKNSKEEIRKHFTELTNAILENTNKKDTN